MQEHMNTSAITIIARNYLAQAIILEESFLRHNPMSQFHTLIVDGNETDRTTSGLKGKVLLPTDLSIDSEVRGRMATIYDVMEFSTALKPKALEFMLNTYSGATLYIDPDIQVFENLDSIFSELRHAPIVLTPHALTPIPRDGEETSEQTIRQAGIFNLGFIGVNNNAGSFLTWWHERLITDGISDIANALFTDQRWIDFVPSLFDFKTLTDPGLNVAYWNLHERTLTFNNDGKILVNGSTLKFFHFSGFDPVTPWLLTKHAGARPRILIGNSLELRTLTAEYAELLIMNNHHIRRLTPYALGETPDGVPLPPIVRRMYRSAWTGALNTLSELPPNPFGPGSTFCSWLMDPIFGSPRQKISRLEKGIWESRLDLQQHFPEIDGADSERFRSWLKNDAPMQELLAPFEKFQIQNPTPRPRENGGWNILGYFSAELGVGEAGRRIATAIQGVGLPVEYVGVNAPASRQMHQSEFKISHQLRYRNSIIAVNADQTPKVSRALGVAGNGNNRRIGFWFWELEKFPSKYRSGFQHVTEVWCASPFTFDALSKVAPVPIQLVTLPIEDLNYRSIFTKSQVGLPESFCFLFTYDFNSVLKRKNPLDVITAYTSAFGPDDGATLVLKSINGHLHKNDLAKVLYFTQHRPDITVSDGYLSSAEVQAQVELADCFISLHRSEGFGLNIATAIAAGKPTIATGYSGNLMFTTPNYRFNVPYDLVDVGRGADPYPQDAIWAQPHLNIASEMMRDVFDNYDSACESAQVARSYLLEKHSLSAAANSVKSHILRN